MCNPTDALPPAPTTLDRQHEWLGETIALEPVDSMTVTTICDNTIDIFLVDQGPAHRLMGRAAGGLQRRTVPAPTLAGGAVIDAPLAQHGFSAHVSFTRAGVRHSVLFDTGITPNGCLDNLDRLDLDPADIEAIVCSHGHFDHTTGLSGLAGRLGRAQLPVVIHPEFWTRRRIAIPGIDPMELPATSRHGLEECGFEIIEARQPSFLFDRSLLVTGEVDRTVGFESGFEFHEAERNGRWEPDPLILDDQALIGHVAGRGLVVLTGCGHAGIVNIVSYAQRLTGIDKIHAVIGGFHLTGTLFEPRIAATVDALESLAPDFIVPAHCTGWRATHTLAARMPDAFLQSSVGTAYELTARI
jgi:7,8-dihydropterin-6-yl-methyl-4-(beta-D-ribofuranosyl)aminobenzene 5'-phosphate synthase